MKNTFLTFITLFILQTSQAQQFFVEVFTGFNHTAYDSDIYETQDWYMPIGIRVAGGLEHVQLGAEYHRDLSHASFMFQDAATGEDVQREEFVNSYYGGLIRFNLSQMPAYRLGVIFKAGAGMYDTSRKSYQVPSSSTNSELDYGPILGFNGGLGLSIPMQGQAHWEIGYVFNYIKRPGKEAFNVPEYNAAHHSIQLGFSWNMVFGAAAKKHTHYKENKRWRNGWRG